MSDDAFITMRIARHALEGHGLHFNAGETGVQAATSPLNLLLVTGIAWVMSVFGASAEAAVLAAPGVVGLFAVPLLGIGIYLLCCARGSASPFAFLAGAFVCVNGFVLSTVGLETILFCALMAFAALAYVRERLIVMGILLGLCFLARHDAGILAALFIGAVYFSRGFPKSAALASVLPFIAVAGPWLVFSALYFGTTVPTTLQSKLAQGGTAYWPAHYYDMLWPRMSDAFFSPVVAGFVLALAAIGVYRAFRDKSKHGTAVLLLFAYSVLHVLAYSLMRLPDYHWYFVPYAVVIVILAGYGLCSIVSFSMPAPASAFAAMVLGAGVYFLMRSQVPVLDPRHDDYKAVADYLNQNPPKEAVGLMEIGIIGFYAPDVRVFDFSGIVTPSQIPNVHSNAATAWLENPSVADKVVIRAEKHPLEPDFDPRFANLYEPEWKAPPSSLFKNGLQVWRLREQQP